MRGSYLCPHCRALLNPHEEIILLLFRDDAKHLVAFSPRVGDYTIHKSGNIHFEEGEVAEFLCPACHVSLSSKVAGDLGEILKEDDGIVTRINFSRTYGKKATFVIGEGEVEGFGPDAPTYQEMNWFGESRFPGEGQI